MNIAIMCEFSGIVREAFRAQGYVNFHFRKPDQIVHPYYFGDDELKRTCLWLKGLPPLIHPDPKTLKRPEPKYRIGEKQNAYFPGMEGLKRKCEGKAIHFTESLGSNKKARSRTFPGIARAMAEQWR